MNKSFDNQKKISVLVIGAKDDTNISISNHLAQHNEINLLDSIQSGQEGIEAIGLLKPDMESVEVVYSIGKRFPGVKILMMSRSNTPDWLRRGMMAGAKNFLCLPLTAEDLYKIIIRTYLGK